LAKTSIFSLNIELQPFSPTGLMQTVLTIAGFDPSSGAGVTADLMVFAAHGLYGTSCITALTVQSAVGVRSTHPTSVDIVSATLDCLNTDLPPAGIKVGMLATYDITLTICKFLREHRLIDSSLGWGNGIVVLDPVLRSTSGRELLDADGVAMLRDRLLLLVDWITPNIEELGVLSGMPVLRRDDLPRASRALQARITRRPDGRRLGILATGGHLDPPDDFLLMPDGEELWLPGQSVVTRSTHGTGCALSSAFLSRLVLGDTPRDAALSAKHYVTAALRIAARPG
jgi:hydroxymethylpyrimidine/phosphomethylpyrimidine kinase